MAAPTDHQQAALRRAPPPTAPRGPSRPPPRKRSRPDLACDSESPPPPIKRQCSGELPTHGSSIHHDDYQRKYDSAIYESYRSSYPSSLRDDDEDDDDERDIKPPDSLRLGNHRVLPSTGLQIRGASAQKGAPHLAAIKYESSSSDAPSNRHPGPGFSFLNRNNSIFWNLPAQFHSPFETALSRLDECHEDLDYRRNPKDGSTAATTVYFILRHLAGLTHSLNNSKKSDSTQTENLRAHIDDLRRKVGDLRERNEKLSDELCTLKKEANVETSTKAREMREAEAARHNTARQYKETVERLRSELEAAKNNFNVSSDALAVQTAKTAELVTKAERLEKKAQEAKDDKAKLVTKVDRLEKEAQAAKDDKVKLEATAEQAAKERHALAIRLKEQSESHEKDKAELRRQLAELISEKNNHLAVCQREALEKSANFRVQLKDQVDKTEKETEGIRRQLKDQVDKKDKETEGIRRQLRDQVDKKEKETEEMRRHLKDQIDKKDKEAEDIRRQLGREVAETARLRTDVELKNKEVNALRRQVESLSNTSRSSAELVANTKNLRSEKNKLASEITGLKVQARTREKEKERLNESVRTLTGEKQGLKNQILSKTTALDKAKEEFDAKVKTLTGEKERLVSENKRLCDEASVLIQAKEKYIAAVNNLTDDMNNITKLLEKKDLEIQRLQEALRKSESSRQQVEARSRLVLLPSQEPDQLGLEAGPHVKQEPQNHQLPTPTNSWGPGFPVGTNGARAISVDTIPSPRGGKMPDLPTPNVAQRAGGLDQRLSALVDRILEQSLGRNRLVIAFAANMIRHSEANFNLTTTNRSPVVKSPGHWEVRGPWVSAEIVPLPINPDTSVGDKFLVLCYLIDRLRDPEQEPDLAAIPQVASSLMRDDYTSWSSTAMAFLETIRSLAPPEAGKKLFSAQRAALALVVCELCRVLEKTVPEASLKRSVWKIGSILGDEAQAAAQTAPIGKLADILSYADGSSAHLTKTQLAAECGDRFCLFSFGGSLDQEMGLLSPSGERDSTFFLMIDFGKTSYRLVSRELATLKAGRQSKFDKYGIAISRCEGPEEEEVELLYVPSAPRKLLTFWTAYILPGIG